MTFCREIRALAGTFGSAIRRLILLMMSAYFKAWGSLLVWVTVLKVHEDIKIYNDREFQKGAKFPPCISVICYFWILDPPATNWFSLFCEACILQCLVSSQLICSVFCSVFLSTWGLSKEETLLWPIVQLKSFNERLPSYLGTPIYDICLVGKTGKTSLSVSLTVWEPESELILSFREVHCLVCKCITAGSFTATDQCLSYLPIFGYQ